MTTNTQVGSENAIRLTLSLATQRITLTRLYAVCVNAFFGLLLMILVAFWNNTNSYTTYTSMLEIENDLKRNFIHEIHFCEI